MSKVANTLYSGMKVSAILLAAAVATGCVSAKTALKGIGPTAETWTVGDGHSLWGIAGSARVYNMPEKWPLIFKANRDTVSDPDLIQPGQVLRIPRNSTASEVREAIQHAKSRGAWTVGSSEFSDSTYLDQ